MRTLYTREEGKFQSITISNRQIGSIASLVKQWTTPIWLGGESLDATGKNDGALGNRSNSRFIWYYHTEIIWIRVAMNELTGTAQPPGASSDVWWLWTQHICRVVHSASNSRIMTAHLAHKAHDAVASRLKILQVEKGNERKRSFRCAQHIS